MREHPDEEGKHVSHETICRSLFVQTRGVPKKELLTHLRATRSIRRSRHDTLKRIGLGRFNGAISIRDRLAEVEDRAVPGPTVRDRLKRAGSSTAALNVSAAIEPTPGTAIIRIQTSSSLVARLTRRPSSRKC